MHVTIPILVLLLYIAMSVFYRFIRVVVNAVADVDIVPHYKLYMTSERLNVEIQTTGCHALDVVCQVWGTSLT